MMVDVSNNAECQHNNRGDDASQVSSSYPSLSQRRIAKKITATMFASLVVATPLLSACGSSNQQNDDFQSMGESQSTTDGSNAPSASNANDWNDSKKPSSNSSHSVDSSTIHDGTYQVSQSYGPINEDSIDVRIDVEHGNVAKVEVVGHHATPISEHYQGEFIRNINDAVVGKPIANLKIDKIGGASWTSDAFNKALDTIRTNAQQQS